jgi:predicted anti-sigma-YlaC factor YlaD
MEAEYHGTACTKFEALLEDMVNGDLGGPEAASVAEHLKSCAGCRAAFDSAVAGTRVLRLAEPTRDPGPAFAHQVMARIRTESGGESKSIWTPFVSMAWKFAATAAMGLAVLVTIDVRGRQNLTSNDVTMTPQSDARDLLSADPANPPRNADDVLILMAESDHGQH